MAHCNMSGGTMGHDALFAWPTADVSFMAPEVAADVVFGRKVEGFDDPAGPRAQLVDELARASAPWGPRAWRGGRKATGARAAACSRTGR